jgi:hypothetical protein
MLRGFKTTHQSGLTAVFVFKLEISLFPSNETININWLKKLMNLVVADGVPHRAKKAGKERK